MFASVQRLNGRCKVSTRVFAGFALVLLLMGFLAAVSINGIGTIRTDSARSSSITQNMLRVGEIDSDFSELRRDVLAYAYTGNTTARDRVLAKEASFNRQFDVLIPAFLSEERRRMATAAKALITEYLQNFRRIAEQTALRDRTVNERMNPMGMQAREALTAITDQAIARGEFQLAALAGQAQEALSLLRIDALRYVSRPDAETAARAATRIGELTRRLEAAAAATPGAADQAALRRVGEIATNYGAAFRDASAAIAEVDRMINEVNRQVAERLGDTLEKLMTAQKDATSQIATKLENETDQTIQLATTAAAVALGLGLLLSWLIGRSIAGPVKQMTTAMTDLAGGKLETEVPARENTDEIGAMAKAVQVFKENAIAVRRLEEETKALAASAEVEKRAAMRQLADDFQQAVGGVVQGVSSAATEMLSSAESLSATAEQTSRQAGAVSAATEEASANVQTVAASAEELAASVAEISRQVANSASIANNAVEQARETDAKVQGLSEAAGQIGDVVKLIADIASRTNLLALNATIEAARAGEAGKGFAVVAAEVKTLATQTARATGEIGAKVSEMQGATSQSVEAIRSIGKVIGEMSAIAAGIASAVEEQGAATQEIARNVQEAARGTQDVATNISGVTQASGETGTAAGQMLGAANDLSRQAETLRREVDQFLGKVRAA